jgi:hypothetical protein
VPRKSTSEGRRRSTLGPENHNQHRPTRPGDETRSQINLELRQRRIWLWLDFASLGLKHRREDLHCGPGRSFSHCSKWKMHIVQCAWPTTWDEADMTTTMSGAMTTNTAWGHFCFSQDFFRQIQQEMILLMENEEKILHLSFCKARFQNELYIISPTNFQNLIFWV